LFALVAVSGHSGASTSTATKTTRIFESCFHWPSHRRLWPLAIQTRVPINDLLYQQVTGQVTMPLKDNERTKKTPLGRPSIFLGTKWACTLTPTYNIKNGFLGLVLSSLRDYSYERQGASGRLVQRALLEVKICPFW
jgi:hypothetical protein